MTYIYTISIEVYGENGDEVGGGGQFYFLDDEQVVVGVPEGLAGAVQA